MYDLFAPIVDNVQTTYTYDEAKKLVAKALEPMGDEYVSVLKSGMESGWIDVYAVSYTHLDVYKRQLL